MTSSSPLPSTKGLTQLEATVHWLVFRQTATLEEEDEFDTNADETDTPTTCHDSHSFVKLRSFPSKTGEISYQERPILHFELQWAGFNGRLNKIADSCYTWWVFSTLSVRNIPLSTSTRSCSTCFTPRNHLSYVYNAVYDVSERSHRF